MSKGDARDVEKVSKWVEMKCLLKGQLFQKVVDDQCTGVSKTGRLQVKNQRKWFMKTGTGAWKRRLKQGTAAKKTDRQEDVSTHLEEIPDKEWEDEPMTLEDEPNQTTEGRKEEAFSCAFTKLKTGKCSSYMLLALSKDDKKAMKELIMEMTKLRNRCDGYESAIRDLTCRCKTYERALEMHRQKIVEIQDSQGTLTTMYGGKSYDLMP